MFIAYFFHFDYSTEASNKKARIDFKYIILWFM